MVLVSFHVWIGAYKRWNTNLKIPNWPGSICIGTGLSSTTQHLDLHWHGSSANTWLHALSEHHLLHALQPQMEARLEDVIIILRTRTKPLTPWHWRWPQCRPRRGESSHQPSCNLNDEMMEFKQCNQPEHLERTMEVGMKSPQKTQ